ncbi:hypothetical protein BX666DRAFT_1886930 [Dichotomocladium elegans]|nr:hypothetical protein BX666DRAFT_1886930 [Dichotomocladium elegans]
MDLQFVVTNLHATRALPWNNMEELSSLWTMFTKCKRQLRNGFRLENMTWRLWYRQAVMGKQTRPAITTEPDLTPISAASSVTPQLSRSRSLPDLSAYYAQNAQTFNAPAEDDKLSAAITSSKFYIDHDQDEESDNDDDYGTIGSSSMYDDLYWTATATATTFSSSPSSIISDEGDTVTDVDTSLFAKQEMTRSIATGLKQESLLSKMFQQEQEQPMSKNTHGLTSTISGGLRRCQSHFNHLDEWFSKAI